MSMIHLSSLDDLYDEAAYVPHDILFPKDTDDVTGISEKELADKLMPVFKELVRVTSRLASKVVKKGSLEEDVTEDEIKTLVCRVEFEASSNFGTRLIAIENPDDITLDQLKSHFFEQCMTRHQLRNEGRYVRSIIRSNDWTDEFTDKDGVPMYDGLKIIAWMPHEKGNGCIYLDLETEWRLFWQICRKNYAKWSHDNQIHFRAWLFKTKERLEYEQEVKKKQAEVERRNLDEKAKQALGETRKKAEKEGRVPPFYVKIFSGRGLDRDATARLADLLGQEQSEAEMATSQEPLLSLEYNPKDKFSDLDVD